MEQRARCDRVYAGSNPVTYPVKGAMAVFEMVARRELTPEQGADLLVLRRAVARARRPWWLKACEFLGLLFFGPVV